MSQPTRIVCALVDARDDESCVHCGISLHSTYGARHHRQLRRHGDHTAANLVLLCTGCHGFVHSEPRLARAVGLIVRSGQDAASVPAYLTHRRAWVLLDRNGTMRTLPDDQAIALLVEVGNR